MSKRDYRGWDADLDPYDRGRPGSFAASHALEEIDAAAEEKHWKENYQREPYCEAGRDFEYYAIAYEIGYEGHARFRGHTFEEVETALEAQYERRADYRHPPWHEARRAARAAWDRVGSLVSGRT